MKVVIIVVQGKAEKKEGREKDIKFDA